MVNEPLVELQKLDCNCNDCIFMRRDFETYNYWLNWRKEQAEADFIKKKTKAIQDAKSIEDPRHRYNELMKASKLKFQFDKSVLLQYGFCDKYADRVSFIPGTCQLHTQLCFEHRREIIVPLI